MAREKSQPVTEKTVFEGLPPHDEAAEAGVLGSMLADERACAVAVEMLKTEDFYLDRHRLLFTLFSDLHQQHPDLDFLFVESELDRRRLTERVGGKDILKQLIEGTPTSANIERYCKIVGDRAIERELIASAAHIVHACRNQSGAEDAKTLLENAEEMIFKITDQRTTQEPVAIHDILENVLVEARKHVDAHMAGQSLPTPAIPTGFHDLDKIFAGGLWPGEVIIVAARPSVGKTTFAINIARKVACRPSEKNPIPVGLFSMEMPKEQVSKNLLCAEAHINSNKMRSYSFDARDFEEMEFAARNLQKAPIFIDDSPQLTPSDLRSRARRLCHREGVKILVVDYLQIMKAPNKDSREQEVAELSRQVKAIARELSIPIVLLSQLRRPMQGEENKKPSLTDLRESGSIEQDADVVIMLHRMQNESGIKAREVFAIVQKNRNGECNEVQLSYYPEQFRFETYVPEMDPQ